MRNNQHYFKISQQNPEQHLDENYFFLEKHPEMFEYLRGVKEIKEILITIKNLKQANEKKWIVEKYFTKLFGLFNRKFSNCSELGCFVNACDTTRDLIKKDYKSFKKITSYFIKKRELDDKVPENWIQAIIDSNSSRRKGEKGEQKLIQILKRFKFKKVKNWKEFKKYENCVARFSTDIFSIENVRKNLNIQIALKKQGKKLDLIVKCNNKKIFLIEAKHLNVGGGEQNKQISELIEIIGLKKERENISYVAFCDGTLSNVLLGKIPKIAIRKLKQREEIEYFLRKNIQNYWLNTSGFVSLFSDINNKN